LTDLLHQYYEDTPIIVSIGNHDFDPGNYQKFTEPNSDFLDHIAELWTKEFFNQDESLTKFKEYGYFGVWAPE